MTLADLLSVLFIAVGLSADCFAVALSGGISARTHSAGKVLRLSLAFGFFQSLMSLLGWLAGRVILDLIADYDHWVAFGLLILVGGRMLWESAHPEKKGEEGDDITRGWPLLVLSVATSIDSLAVGLSFALLTINIAFASASIGAMAFVVTATGFLLGKRASRLLGRRAEVLGGLILVAIGIRILLSHLF